MMRPYFFYTLALCLASGIPALFNKVSAQSRKEPGFGVDIETLMRQRDQEKNLSIGLPLPPFSATTSDGRLLNNDLMAGKVYLLVIFHPDCRCFEPKALSATSALEAKHKDFRVVALLQDTNYLYVYRQEHPEPLNYAVTATREQMLALQQKNGTPVYVLVDRKGIVTKILSTAEIYRLNESKDDQSELAKSVEEALMRY